MKQALVVGAAGDVGQGIVRALISDGWQVIGVGRSMNSLLTLRDSIGQLARHFTAIVGDLASEATTGELAESVGIQQLDAVVNTISARWPHRRLAEMGYDEIAEHFAAYLRPHFNALKVLVPQMRSGATYLAMGGGMADAVFSGLVPLSMTQAAQRMLIRGWCKETRGSQVAVRELMIASNVNGRSTRDVAASEWVTDDEIGQRAVEIISRIGDFPDPILAIAPDSRRNP